MVIGYRNRHIALVDAKRRQSVKMMFYLLRTRTHIAVLVLLCVEFTSCSVVHCSIVPVDGVK